MYHRSEPSPTTVQRRSVLIERPKELSVIEGRRAQNCTIMLSKIKMSDKEIREVAYVTIGGVACVTMTTHLQVIMTMDRDDKLSKDMVEQMVKYVPKAEEEQLLQSHAHEKGTFARADKFMWEMSR